MIDTAQLCYLMTDKMRSKLDQKCSSNTTVKFYPDRIYIRHPFGLSNIPVRFDKMKRTMCVELSLPKLFQGHNVFGSNDVHGLSLKAIEFIYQSIQTPCTSAEIQAITEAGIRLRRLDTNCTFLLPNRHMVGETLDEIMHHLVATGKQWAAYGRDDVESVYNQIHSTRVSDKFYDKYAQLQQRGASIPTTVEARDKVTACAQHALRFETTWRGKELDDLGLDYTDRWSSKLVRKMIAQRLEGFQFSGMIRQCLNERELEGLNQTSQMFYGLWTEGAHLRRHRRCRTLRRTRDLLLEAYGVDIYRSRDSRHVRSLAQLLHPDNAYYFAPRSLVRAGAIYRP